MQLAVQLLAQVAIREASNKRILEEFYAGFINTSLDIFVRDDCCDEAIGEGADVSVVSRHYFSCMCSDEFKRKLHENDDNGQAYGDSVIHSIIESFCVLNGETDCVPCLCQTHAYAANGNK